MIDMKKKLTINNRLIAQLKNNHELMDTQIKELIKERDELLNEVEFYRKDNQRMKLDQLPNKGYKANGVKSDGNLSNTQIIRDWKDKIFDFLINEKDKNDTRQGFYHSIVNLLTLAKETEEDDSFDLKTLVEVYSQEGKKHFGPNYVFHEINNKESEDLNLIKRLSRKNNKSEERLPCNSDLNHKIDDDIKSIDPQFSKA